MPPLKKIVPLIGISLILSGCSLPGLASKRAALQVTSAPRATIFLEGKHVGETPFLDDKLKPGEYTLKLIPEDPTGKLPAWETKIQLNPQILTVVNREIAATDQESTGAILTLEPLSSKTKSPLAIISLPDSAVIKVDNQPRGFAPQSLEDIAAGEHTVTLTQTGYKEKSLQVKTWLGFKLTLSVQLAKENLLEIPKPTSDQPEPTISPIPATSPLPSPKASPQSIKEDQPVSASAVAKTKPYVEILPNSIGFLRIREEPMTTSSELARAVAGQHLPYLDEEKNGWYKVSYATGKTGWLARGASGEYARLVK